MKRKFVESRGFSADRDALEKAGDLTSEDLALLELEIMKNPHAGDVIRGTGGLRKIRLAQRARGRGRRGGWKPSMSKTAKRSKSSAFDKIRSGLEDAVAYHRDGKKLTVREVDLPEPPPRIDAEQISALRESLGVSQAVFAGILNVSTKTVQAWEIGARQPSDAALRLLEIAQSHPEVLLSTLGDTKVA